VSPDPTESSAVDGQSDTTGTPPDATPLVRLLEQAEHVQDKVAEAATDLSEVNTKLKTHVSGNAPFLDVVDALDHSSEIEVRVHEAAEELVVVNDSLAAEIEARQHLEDELVRSRSALTVSHLREQRARHDSLHDVVTGLPNARLFADRLETAIAQAERHGWRLAVMFIDLDAFKSVNDRYGHHVGDELLCVVAERLRENVRGGDSVCRRSGDEFLVLLLEIRDRESAAATANALLAEVAAPCTIDGVSLEVRASLGIAMYPEDGRTPLELLKHADAAMYGKKRQSLGDAVSPAP